MESEDVLLQFPISRKAVARVFLTGDISQEAIQQLIKILELEKDTFPTQAEIENVVSNNN
ncbi:MAG TPA: hypothetical protein VF599_12605 [Pyrinomonadaceae bacterium]|jgi:hypothetical protein